MSAIELIAAERARQITVERWTPSHDDRHSEETIALAAACYAMPANFREVGESRHPDDFGKCPALWPWDSECWKPTPGDRVRELVKAGALIAAEIDRLQRAEAARTKGAAS